MQSLHCIHYIPTGETVFVKPVIPTPESNHAVPNLPILEANAPWRYPASTVFLITYVLELEQIPKSEADL
jgi:hypothetical protein